MTTITTPTSPQGLVADDGPAGAWRLTWLSGPDAGRTGLFGDGRWVIGRARLADVRCDDPALEPFHAQVTLWPHGEVTVQQLAGRTPVRRDGAVLRLGASSLSMSRSECPPAAAAAGGSLPPGCGELAGAAAAEVVVRSHRTVTAWNEPALVVPPAPQAVDRQPPSPTVLVTAGVAVAGALVIAVVAGQPMFALFAAFGAVAAGVSWGADRIAHARAVRRSVRRHAAALTSLAADMEAQRDRYASHHREVTGTLATAVDTAHTSQLWNRRPLHGDAFTVALGVGRVPWRPALVPADGVRLPASPFDGAGLEIDDLAVTLDLGPGARVAMLGAHADALVRSVLVQLATTTGPADWQLVVATDDPTRWAWLDGIPHAQGAGPPATVWDDAALLDATRCPEGWADRHTVVVTDRTHQLALRTGPLRRMIAAAADVAVVAVDASGGAAPPAICTTVVATSVDGTARLLADTSDDPPLRFRVTGVGDAAAASHVRMLAGRRDPEDPRDAALALPAAVGLTDLAGGAVATADAIVQAWRAAGHDVRPATAIGVADDGVVDLDLVRDGPHALIAGTTGSGKSEILRSMVIGLCAAAGPDQVTFVLVDYKGGAAFDCCVELPHVVGVVTDLDDGLADRVLRSLRAELTARERLLRTHGAADLEAMRSQCGDPVVPRLVVVVDEFAALAAEHPDVLSSLVGIAQRGRSLGVHLVLATQRPSGVISDEIRANTNLRLALRLHDAADASDVVADPAPSTFRRSQPGRAALRLGPGELVVFQAARCTDAAEWVAAIRDAAANAELLPVRRPWCDPLPVTLTPEVLGAGAGDPGAIGLVDMPDEQAQRPLRWRPADGHLLVVGSPASGVTATLVTAAGCAVGDDAEVLVIDPSNDGQWTAVADHPSCAGVVRLHERERLMRLLRRATADPATADSATARSILVVIDGLAALRADLEAIEREHERVLLDRLITDPPPGCTLLLGADRVAGVPSSVTALCPNRWLLHVHDRHDAGLLGSAGLLAPPAVPGRMVVASGAFQGRAAQVVAPAPWPDAVPSNRVAPFTVLPARIGPLPVASTHLDHTWLAVVGMSFDALAPVVLDVADGDHLLVVGPGRSGRSTALAVLASAWRQAHPRAAVVAVAPRRSPWVPSSVALSDALADVDRHRGQGRPTLLVVDDAEMVDDPTGRLAALVDERSSLLLVAAAGRPDALRHAYGHWTGAVRRSRLGIAMAACADVDGDLLGMAIPRRMPLAARPGLAWVTAGGSGCELAQLSLADPPPAAYRDR
jgi:DNA segregation ATPase FtsK/SpoIIIE, S-DNA-T family